MPKKTPLDSLMSASDDADTAFGGVAFVYLIDEKRARSEGSEPI
jgi:hypothetical protein